MSGFKKAELFFKKHNKAVFYAASFLLPFFLTLILFALRRISPFGNITFLKKDLYQQYLPFFYEYYRKLKAKESLWYSWNGGLGANFLAVIAYYLASPLNLLSVFFPEKYILEFMTYSVVIKTGLMGLTFSSYLSYHFKEKKVSMIFFSIAYSMSAYMAAYNWNIEWMDVLFIAPLVLKGLEKTASSDSPLTYYLSLSYAIFTNYYLSIMLCIYSLLYFIVLNVIKGPKAGNIIKFSLFSLLSGLTGSVLILPEYFALRFTTFTNIRFPKEIRFYLPPWDLLMRHFPAVETETGLNHSPNIYCGVILLFLIAFYGVSEKTGKKEKLCYLSLLLFFLLSFNVNFLNFIWHGLNYPDSLPARQGYLYVILLLTLGYEGLSRVRDLSDRSYFLSLIIPVLLSVLTLIFSKDTDLTGISRVLTLIFLLCFTVLLTAFRYSPDRFHYPGNRMEIVSFSLILFSFALEIFLNMYFTNNRTIKRTDYFSKFEDYRILNGEMKAANIGNDSLLYRADEVSRNVRNDSLSIGYSSLSFFSSTVNGLLIKNMSKYGFMNSRVFYLSEGSTAFTSLLYGQKYIFVPGNTLFTGEDLSSPYKFSNGAVLCEFSESIPNGYILRPNDETEKKLFMSALNAEKIIDSKIPSPNGEETPPEAQNALLRDLNISGTALMKYGTEDDDTIIKENGRVILSFTDSCHLYAYNFSKTAGELSVKMSDGTPEGKMNSDKYRYIYDLGFHKEGTTASFVSENDKDKDLDLEFYKLNESVLSAFADSLNSSESLREMEQGPDYLKGTIEMKEKGHLIVQIPYEPGWTLFVDGRRTHIDLFDALWISTDLSKGKHEILLRFFPKGLKAGAIISLLSILLALLSLKYEAILRKRRIYREKRMLRRKSRAGQGQQDLGQF